MVNKNITRITWSTLAVSNCKLLYVCTSTYIIEYCKYACVDIDIVAIPEVRHSRGLLPLAVAVRVSPDVGAWLGPHILVAVLEAVGPAHDDSEGGARTCLETGAWGATWCTCPWCRWGPHPRGWWGFHWSPSESILWDDNHVLSIESQYLPLYLQYHQNGALTLTSLLVTIH